ncbi:hypothetical protein GCK72_020077 [Caenorhabditis remanei]|uniref:Uncharacterized protein n=1 Tax=Caenorhabditis remanei TaxID=31234 RepID=A0A6A5GEJ2_CAERE|nr:hypothetical protein GCK72_020077 [Caenorhabditis remanei]KAF1753520.1 hypothetical protein GCK72_020077 [Caenorhabditis remanei]
MASPGSSDSSSSKSPPVAMISTTNCEICGQQAHGNHYGALSCRACAAFFRRYGVSNDVKSCKKNGTCVVLKKGWFNCKKCRLKKCWEKGMKIDSFQFGRDPEKVTKALVEFIGNVPPSMDTFLGRPNYIIYCAPSAEQLDNAPPRVIIDVQFLIDKAEEVLLKGLASPIFALNPLEKLAFGLQQIRRNVRKQTKIITKIGKEEAFALFEDEMLKAAEWLTYYDDFSNLPHQVQLAMLKGIWKAWTRLDKLDITAKGRKQNMCGSQQIMAHLNKHRVLCDLRKMKIDVSWCSRYTVEQLQFFSQKETADRSEESIQLMLELQPTDVELAFMMCQLSFQYVGKRFQGVILEVSDRFLESISNHLHDYYVNDLNMPQYSKRLVKMMKINNHIQQDILYEREKIQLLKVFDVYYADYSHSEVFRDI